MTTLMQIKKEQQQIARCEQSLALEKLKKRRADTRRKIALGGLVIKAGMDGFNKSVILGALMHGLTLMGRDENYTSLFRSIGDEMFRC